MQGEVICPMCGGPGAHAFRVNDRNRETTGEQFDYHRCSACATIFIAPVPDGLPRYYEGGYYPFDEDGRPIWKRERERYDWAAWRVRLLGDFASPGPLIEIGAGTGAFAVAAAEAGYEVTAIEMDPGCCRFLESEGIAAVCSDDAVARLRTMPPARVVAMWHVLEHLPNPLPTLEAVAASLEPGGVFAVGVPNTASLQFRLLGPRWPHVDAPRHLCLVSPGASSDRCSDLGNERDNDTASDPPGHNNDRFGWVYGASRRPARNAQGVGAHAGLWLSRLLAPVERRGLRGSSLTALLRKRA